MPKKSYWVAVTASPGSPLQTRQLEAKKIDAARIALAQLIGQVDLPDDTLLMEKADIDAEGETAWQL